jgi:class 3 adenylate cyclase/tetratricopeptide (TPR) repeat protein
MASLLTMVFTDVVESSATKRDVSLGRDSGERDHAYLEKVQTRHFNLIRECSKCHGGREVSTMGDAFYLIFENPVDAIRCAADIQKRLAAEPIETPRGPLRLRIGIHSGFPEVFEGSYHGTDVDTAARVEATASERQILLSSTTYELVRQMTDVKFHRVGEFALKGVGGMVLWEADWDGKGPRATAVPPLAAQQRKKQTWFALGALAVGVVLAATVGYRYSRSLRAAPLTDRDTIVLADFTNTTGDPVFNGTLRQGLSAQLEQSPFLNLLSDRRITQTLILMAQPREARLTRELARGVCVRTGSTATIEGSISTLGSQYVLGLNAINCHSDERLAEEQITANRKEQVLKALGEAATKIRGKLGESLASIEKYDAPPENVTTPSLEALQAYSLGYQAQNAKNDPVAAIPLFQRAISLDPNFAMAWARLGTNYGNLGEPAQAAENTRKAYELRERVSEREKFYIDSHYEQFVTGDLEAARKAYELWAQTYPRDVIPPTNLGGSIYWALGQYDKAFAADQQALQLDPSGGISYGNLVQACLYLNRLDEAKATAQEAQAHNVDSAYLHSYLYLADFLRHDAAAMEREAAGLMGKLGYEDVVLQYQSDAAAYAGQFAKARELTRRAVNSAVRADEKETAADYEAEAAVREALVGNTGLATKQPQAALTLSKGRDVAAIAAIAMSLAGDSAQALRLANDLSRRFPKDTIVQSEYLPMIRAAGILGSGDASKGAPQAVEALAESAPYELGNPFPGAFFFALYPLYLRGEAYLAAHQGALAAAEFQRILDHPGVVLNEPIGALAHLGLGRAYALEAGIPGSAGVSPAVAGASRSRKEQQVRGQEAHALAGETPTLQRARTAYQYFFTLWKDADPDIPLLKQAKAEYARLE